MRTSFTRRKRLGVTSTRCNAFTLMELVAVLAVIIVLAAMVLPALARAKDNARDLACRNNLRQLSICFHDYVVNNLDKMPPNNSVSLLSGAAPSTGLSWCPDQADKDTNTAALQSGVLFPYNRSPAIYRCPADASTVLGHPGQLRNRSYNMSQSLNGCLDYPNARVARPAAYQKLSQVRPHKDPGGGVFPLFLFIDEDPDTMVDAQFGNPIGVNNPAPRADQWYDLPGDRHNRGCNLSFTDAHVEHTQWKIPKKGQVTSGGGVPLAAGEQPDLNFIQSRMKWWSDN